MNSEQLSTFEDGDSLLEAFEAAWNSGSKPDVFAYASRCPADELRAVLSELFQIDLERRWKNGNAKHCLTLSQYFDALPSGFSDEELIELVCWEYQMRNQYGDCLPRSDVFQTFPHLGRKLIDRIDEVAERIHWPVLSVVVSQERVCTTKLDRIVSAGRQQSVSELPWTVFTKSDAHHVVLCGMHDASLSRKQFVLSLKSPTTLLVENTSVNRAMAVERQRPKTVEVIDAGATRICELPVTIHLGSARHVRISSGGDLPGGGFR